METFLTVAAIAAYIGTPIVLVLGWLKWIRQKRDYSIFSWLALISFVFGTSSALLALGSLLYARTTGGFRYHDPTLMKIYGCGMILSIIGLVLSLGGVWRRNPLRWYAPVLSLGMIVLWVLWASAE